LLTIGRANSEQYHKVAKFVNKFFDNVSRFRGPGGYTKWKVICVAWSTVAEAFAFGALVLASYLGALVFSETVAAPEEFSVSDVTGQAGKIIPLNIIPNQWDSPEDLFAITGLPPEVKLSGGSAYDDFWLVRRKELSSLSIITPNAFSRKFQIAVTRVRSADRPPVTLTATISVINKAALNDPGIPESDLPKLAPDQEQKMLKRASDLMIQNDIAGARLIYRYLANHRSASGAFALAESYDAKKWAGRHVAGMAPDASLAAAWYARAAELESKEASSRDAPQR
jgi:hypothetical protein